MSGFRMVSVVTLVIATTLLVEECLGQGLPGGVGQAYYDALDSHGTPSTQPSTSDTENTGSESLPSTDNSLWKNHAPSTPAASDVECSLEVHRMKHVGGRCTRLRGSKGPYICQSGRHINFYRDCERIFQNREQEHPSS